MIDIARRNGPHAAHRAGDEHLHTLPAPGSVADDVAQRLQARSLQGLLAQLPDTQREVITLAFYGQLTHTEIAEHLDLPAGTVKGRMRLGLQRLRGRHPTRRVLATRRARNTGRAAAGANRLHRHAPS